MANPLAPVTLTADTVETFTLERNYTNVEVLNGTGSAEVFYTTDGNDPVVDGAGCFYLPAAIGALGVTSGNADAGATVVKAISAGTPKVAVRGLD